MKRATDAAPLAILCLCLCFIAALHPAAAAEPRTALPRRSAVLFIGDGMGPAYVTATRLALGGSGGRLHLDDLPRTALLRTHPAGGLVTDSAAAASAMACGRKTMNGVLCEDASAVNDARDGKKLESVALWAAKRGMRIGLVTTTRVTHATPAAFYAVDNNRDHERAIARAAVDSPLDILLGGGAEFFRPGPPVPDDHGWQPSDREDLVAAARARGWSIVRSAGELRAVTSIKGRRVLGLFADSHLPYEAEGGRDRPAPGLVEMTRWAIAALQGSGRPFFLMVEGGRIDHAGHENLARTLVDETAAFDEAVGVAVGRLDPKTTLVLVTADHETGGLAINGYPSEREGVWSTVDSEGGDKPYPVLTFSTGPGTTRPVGGAPHGAEDARPSGIALGDAAHTGVDVALYGWGVGSEAVRGTLENTAVYTILRATLEGRVPDRSTLIREPR